MNLAESLGSQRSLEMILLYPAMAARCDLKFEMFGHQLRIYALDLNRPWRAIHDDLLGLLSTST